MSAVRARVTSDPVRAKATVFPYLQRDPVLNTALLSNIEGRIRGLLYDPAPPVFVSLHRDDEVVGAVVCTALRGVLLGDLAEDLVPAVLTALEDTGAPYVEGTPEVTRAFAEQYAAGCGLRLSEGAGPRTGVRDRGQAIACPRSPLAVRGPEGCSEDRLTRLHRLVDFTPQHADGKPRPATAEDLAAVTRLIAGFRDDTGGRVNVDEERQWARGRIESGLLRLWEDGGRVVSMAGHHGALFGVDRIGPVYTPPADRGHGYAAALTADLTRRILDAGNQACLFTVVANATSNKIYARIGYRQVVDFVRYKIG